MKKIIITLALFACFFGYSQRIFTGKLIDFNKCNIVIASNSLGTPQFGSTPWPTQLQSIINNPNCTLTNLSVSGKSISEILADFPFQIPQLFQPGKTNVLIVHEMINERFFQRSPTLAISIEKFKTYCLKARALGWKVIVITQYDTVYTCRQELLDFNVWLLANYSGIANGIVDVWQNPIYRDATNKTNFPDGIHPGPVGVAPMAGMVYQKLRKLAR